MDYVLPLNNRTRDKQFLLDGEYPFDRNEYYGLVYLFEFFLTWSTIFMIVGADSTYIGSAQHGIALIRVLKYGLCLNNIFETPGLFFYIR